MITWEKFANAINIENRDHERIKSAFDYGEKMHKGQFRRNSGLPYFIHPIRVSMNLREEDDDLVIAGLLHDIVEDTDQTVEDIEEKFGYRVAQLVKGVTKTDEIPMFEALDSVIEEFPETIKLRMADRMDNLSDKFDQMPQKTKDRYNEETPRMIEIAKELGITDYVDRLQKLHNLKNDQNK